ncbi:hypothetical protein [Sandaracinus amylolyticus]|uniref:hypothetical protein n=1 Tax=Sandaracinus amylolyticus TaxID=927083 RepID=UPI001F301EA6|nr:hypothetical protein [Sandaracinus amylolyticus]UJR82137.1 Hypothetical protein I5071_42020 [Sandaracinus amylolyticus]
MTTSAMRSIPWLALVLIAACNPDHIDLDLAPFDAGSVQPGLDAGRDAGAREDAASPSDAGGHDAGTPPLDAGRSCEPFGDDCHPLYDASCRCGFDSFSAEWACGTSGSRGVGGICNGTDDCGPGLYCTRTQTVGGGVCRRLCDADADCAAGEGCAEIGRLAPCTGWCVALAECDLSEQDCGAGRGCYWLRDEEAGREHQFCHPAGEETRNCYGGPTVCAPGVVCVRSSTSSLRCQPLCTTSEECPIATSCTGTTSSGEQFCR